MKSVAASERNWAHRLIEEFMLAANETVASHLEQRGVPSLYRIHEKPDAKRIYEFETLAASFGYSLGVGALPIKRVQTRGDKRHYRESGRKPRPSNCRKKSTSHRACTRSWCRRSPASRKSASFLS